MKLKLKVPRLSMNMVEATITKWHLQPGQSFTKGDTLYELETEKVTNEIEAEQDGTLLEILAGDGTDVEVGDPVCRVEYTQ